MSVYEGSFMVEMDGKQELRYLKFLGTQLMFYEGKILRGIFNLTNTSVKLEESGGVIILKSPNTTCYLRNSPEGSKSELNILFKHLTEAKLPNQVQTPIDI